MPGSRLTPLGLWLQRHPGVGLPLMILVLAPWNIFIATLAGAVVSFVEECVQVRRDFRTLWGI